MKELTKEDRMLIVESLKLRAEYCEELADEMRESRRHRRAREFSELSDKLERLASRISVKEVEK